MLQKSSWDRIPAGNLWYLLPLIMTLLVLGSLVMEAQTVSSSLTGAVVDTTVLRYRVLR